MTDLAQVNQELLPWMRMTRPAGSDVRSLDSAPLGQRLFRSWLLLGGVLPVDLDDLTIVELEPGRRFLERSRMVSASSWEHERLVEPLSGSTCRLTDRLRFVPRSKVHEHVLGQVVPRLFSHRHARLRRRYGQVHDVEG